MSYIGSITVSVYFPGVILGRLLVAAYEVCRREGESAADSFVTLGVFTVDVVAVVGISDIAHSTEGIVELTVVGRFEHIDFCIYRLVDVHIDMVGQRAVFVEYTRPDNLTRRAFRHKILMISSACGGHIEVADSFFLVIVSVCYSFDSYIVKYGRVIVSDAHRAARGGRINLRPVVNLSRAVKRRIFSTAVFLGKEIKVVKHSTRLHVLTNGVEKQTFYRFVIIAPVVFSGTRPRGYDTLYLTFVDHCFVEYYVACQVVTRTDCTARKGHFSNGIVRGIRTSENSSAAGYSTVLNFCVANLYFTENTCCYRTCVPVIAPRIALSFYEHCYTAVGGNINL